MHISFEPLDGIELQPRNYNYYSFLLLNLHFNAGIIRKPLKYQGGICFEFQIPTLHMPI